MLDEHRPLYFLLKAVKELLIIYSNVYHLIGFNFKGSLVKPSKFSFAKGYSQKNLDSVYREGLDSAGGYLSFLFFRRRINKKLSQILSTCYFYKTYEQEPNQLKINEEIINITTEYREKFNTIKGEKSQKANLILQLSGLIIAMISSSVIISKLADLFKFLSSTGALNLLTNNIEIAIPVVWAIIWGFLLAIFFRYWDEPKKWYDKMILTNKIEYREILVTDYLALLQSNIISKMSVSKIAYQEDISSFTTEYKMGSVDYGLKKQTNLLDKTSREREQKETEKQNKNNMNKKTN